MSSPLPVSFWLLAWSCMPPSVLLEQHREIKCWFWPITGLCWFEMEALHHEPRPAVSTTAHSRHIIAEKTSGFQRNDVLMQTEKAKCFPLRFNICQFSETFLELSHHHLNYVLIFFFISSVHCIQEREVWIIGILQNTNEYMLSQ